MPTLKTSSWRHFDLVMQSLGIYVGLFPLLWLVAVVGGGLSDVGHPGGEARGMTFMANALGAVPHVYLIVSLLLLVLSRYRNAPCLVVNGLAFVASAYYSL